MKRLTGTATGVVFSTLLAFAALAQSGKAPNVQVEVKEALEAAGFKDVKIDPYTFAVQAKDPSGSPVTIVISPDTFGAAAKPEPQENTVISRPGSPQKGGRSQNGEDESATGSLGDLNERHRPTLTPGQKQAIWDSLSSEKTMGSLRTTDFSPQVGATVPRIVSIRPLPDDVTDNVPALIGYHFAVVGNEIVIVSPSSKKVVDIFGEQ